VVFEKLSKYVNNHEKMFDIGAMLTQTGFTTYAWLAIRPRRHLTSYYRWLQKRRQEKVRPAQHQQSPERETFNPLTQQGCFSNSD